MSDESTNSKPNPENLPVIEENSLHRIVTTVKLYQEFNELGKEKFEEIYGKADPKSLEGVCYNKYYEGKADNERFGLVRNPNVEATSVSPFLELGSYLRVNYLRVNFRTDETKPEIESQKPFYWKEWNLEEDICESYEEYTKGRHIIYFRVNGVKYELDVSFKNIFIGKISKKPTTRISINKVSFKNLSFLEEVDFSNLFIKSWLSLQDNVFYKKVSFKEARVRDIEYNHFFISNCTFDGGLDLSNVNSPHKVTNCAFSCEIAFNNCVFDENSKFDGFECKNNCKLDFSHSTFKENFTIQPNLEESQQLTVNFSNSTFEKKLYFSVLPDTKDNYSNTTLGLYHTSFADFVCDDINLSKVNLLYDYSREDKEKTEKAIAERRVFRKILQDLNWGDKADEEYAKIMDLQLKLDFLEENSNKLNNFCKKWVYQELFGWGVRMKNIARTSLIFISLFTVIYCVYDILVWLIELPGDQGLRYILPEGGIPVLSHLRFSVWNSFLLADLSANYGWLITFISTIQGVLGIIYVTVLVAIISRKFMRM